MSPNENLNDPLERPADRPNDRPNVRPTEHKEEHNPLFNEGFDPEIEQLLAGDEALLAEIEKLQRTEFGYNADLLPPGVHLSDEDLQLLAEGKAVNDLTLREHLKNCNYCADNLQQYKLLFDLLNDTKEDVLPDSFNLAVLDKVKRFRRAERRRKSPLIPVAAILVALTAVISYLGIAAGGAGVWQVLERGSAGLAENLGWTLANMPTGLWAAVVLAVYYLLDLLIQRKVSKA